MQPIFVSRPQYLMSSPECPPENLDLFALLTSFRGGSPSVGCLALNEWLHTMLVLFVFEKSGAFLWKLQLEQLLTFWFNQKINIVHRLQTNQFHSMFRIPLSCRSITRLAISRSSNHCYRQPRILWPPDQTCHAAVTSITMNSHRFSSSSTLGSSEEVSLPQGSIHRDLAQEVYGRSIDIELEYRWFSAVLLCMYWPIIHGLYHILSRVWAPLGAIHDE